MITLKRIYDDEPASGKFRLLIDRLWPRGLRKEEVKIDLWLKEIAPGSDLRKWFNHDPAKWKSFKEKYKIELKQKKNILSQIKHLEKQHKEVVLLYAAKDEAHNNAVVLKEVLDAFQETVKTSGR